MTPAPKHPAPPTEDGTPIDDKSYPGADLIRHTIRVWEPRLGRSLSEEDARRILENVVGFFRVLHIWDRRRRNADSDAKEIDSDGA